jgi:uncharacterized DUF497 family protein
MQNDKFEWDDAKAKTNAALHGVTFELASQSFSDPFALELLDDREDYGEERLIRLGMVEGTILSVVYTERSGRSRLISARFATRVEQDEYYKRASE